MSDMFNDSIDKAFLEFEEEEEIGKKEMTPAAATNKATKRTAETEGEVATAKKTAVIEGITGELEAAGKTDFIPASAAFNDDSSDIVKELRQKESKHLNRLNKIGREVASRRSRIRALEKEIADLEKGKATPMAKLFKTRRLIELVQKNSV